MSSPYLISHVTHENTAIFIYFIKLSKSKSCEHPAAVMHQFRAALLQAKFWLGASNGARTTAFFKFRQDSESAGAGRGTSRPCRQAPPSPPAPALQPAPPAPAARRHCGVPEAGRLRQGRRGALLQLHGLPGRGGHLRPHVRADQRCAPHTSAPALRLLAAALRRRRGRKWRRLRAAAGIPAVDIILLFAAAEGDVPKVEELLKAGAKVDVADLDGRTPMARPPRRGAPPPPAARGA